MHSWPHDPELPAGFQDADLEMRELQEAANDDARAKRKAAKAKPTAGLEPGSTMTAGAPAPVVSKWVEMEKADEARAARKALATPAAKVPVVDAKTMSAYVHPPAVQAPDKAAMDAASAVLEKALAKRPAKIKAPSPVQCQSASVPAKAPAVPAPAKAIAKADAKATANAKGKATAAKRQAPTVKAKAKDPIPAIAGPDQALIEFQEYLATIK